MEIISGVVGELVNYTVAPIGRQFGYLIFYGRKVNDLKEQLNKMDAEREALQHKVDEARRNGEEIERNFQEWLDGVDKIKKEAEKLYQEEIRANARCSYKSCPNLWLRHQLSRRAKKMVEEIVKVKGEGKFERVSYHKPPQWAATSSTSFSLGGEAFESRVRTLNRIMEALADPTINMVGLHGLPGVGKSTLAEEVAKKAQVENLFDMVVMVEVKQNPNITKIQREIADMVGLKFEEESEVVRAHRLLQRLKQEEKLLVILDDLWGRLNLLKIGIPLPDEKEGGKIPSIGGGKMPLADEYKGCKMLLTSRKEEVLSCEMNCKRNIMVEELSQEEARKLFKVMADLNEMSQPDLLTRAAQVNEKCAGLPLAVVTVARALRNKSPFEWRDALHQLEQPALRKVPGLKDVDFSIKLSYDHLESRELQSFFLLSALLANDALSSDLFKYCIGLGLFQGIYTVEEAFDRLQTLIKMLKASCLLLDGSSSDRFKIHNVVGDSALSIAFNENHALVKRYEKIHEWPDKDHSESCRYMCFRNCDIKELPHQLYCPSSEVLLFEFKHDNLKMPDDIFRGMSLLRVLGLTNFNFYCLPASITLLTNLTSLCLHQCGLKDIAMIGDLENLKVLSLVHSTIEQLPHKLGHLTRLQLLDLSNCRKLQVIPQNIICSLKKLEALYLENSFNRWQDEESNVKTTNASIAEIKQLGDLSSLLMHVLDASILPKDLFLDKLKRYKLLIGDVWEWPCKYETSKMLKLKLKTSIHSELVLKRLLESVEALYLDELIGINNVNVAYELNKTGFPYLQHLWIQNNSQIECIINSTPEIRFEDAFPELETSVLDNVIHMEKLCQGQLTTKSFTKLRVIEVESCHQMKSLFSIAHVRHFSQLEEIKITTCRLMNQIVDLDNNTIHGMVQFHKLHSLTLSNLPKFVGFCIDDTRSFESLFNNKVIFPNLHSLRLSSINSQKIWHDSLSACSWIQSLTNLTIEGCGGLQNITSIVQAISLVNLKHLEISRCEKVEEIFFRTEDVKGKEALSACREEVIFPCLQTMILTEMDNLQKIWPDQCTPNCFNKLKNVEIDNCEKLVIVFPSYMLDSLSHVEIVAVTHCVSIETLYDLRGYCNRGRLGEMKTNLRNLKLVNLPNLRDIWNNDPRSLISFSNLRTVYVQSCERLKNIFPAYVALNLNLLEQLIMHSCKIEEVVAKEENVSGITTFDLPCLTSLCLMDLYKLKSFHPGRYILECRKLEHLFVNCPKMELFGLETKDFPVTRDHQPLFSVDKVVPYLGRLWSSGNEARKLWRGQFREDLFHNITVLYLNGLQNKAERFPYWFLHKVPNLKKFGLNSCSFREVFPVRRVVAEEKQTADIVRLKHLLLWKLPRLESICKRLQMAFSILQK